MFCRIYDVCFNHFYISTLRVQPQAKNVNIKSSNFIGGWVSKQDISDEIIAGGNYAL
jgi:hypothetical protein